MIAVEYALQDWIALILFYCTCIAILFVILFQAPIGDILMRRRMRKKAEYQRQLRQKHQRKYEKVGQSRWHGKN